MHIIFLFLFSMFPMLSSNDERALTTVPVSQIGGSFKWYAKPFISQKHFCGEEKYKERSNIFINQIMEVSGTRMKRFYTAAQCCNLDSAELREAVSQIPDSFYVRECIGFQKKLILLPQEIQNQILDYVFGEHNKKTLQNFHNSSYANASLKLAYTLEKTRKYPIEWLSVGDRFFSSPDLNDIYIKLDAARKKKSIAQISSYEEYIIRKEMPEKMARILAPTPIDCQSSYKSIFFDGQGLSEVLESTLHVLCGVLSFQFLFIMKDPIVDPLIIEEVYRNFLIFDFFSFFSIGMSDLLRYRNTHFLNQKTIGGAINEKTSQDTIEKFLAIVTQKRKKDLLMAGNLV
jgi:hypothetical protein